MSGHIVTSFDDDLAELDRVARAMWELDRDMVEAAIEALVSADGAAAVRVVAEDTAVDALQRDLDQRAITLIAKRQPMAQDLRMVIGAIRMGGDLERIGDLAKNIAKRVDAVGSGARQRGLSQSIETMSRVVLEQAGGIIEAYVGRDTEALVALRRDDEKIDTHYTAIFRELLTYMMEDPRNITACTHLLFCAKNLERIGDHATNIAENAYYIMVGEQLPIHRPKRDETQVPADAG